MDPELHFAVPVFPDPVYLTMPWQKALATNIAQDLMVRVLDKAALETWGGGIFFIWF